MITIKNSSVIGLVLLVSATLTSCVHVQTKDAAQAQENIDKATAAIAAAAGQAEKDPTRPVYHFLPPAQWMNDVCGTIYHKGYYHLCYLINPFGDYMATVETWGHARSRDLVHWEHLPIPFWPCGEPWERAIYTGGAAIDGHGRPMFFWTANPRGGFEKRTVGAAVSDDEMILWKKCPGNPIMRRGTHGDPKFRGGWDAPYLFTEKGRTFVIFGAILGDDAVVPIYEAANRELTRWTYRGIIFRDAISKVRDLECPNFAKLGDQWMLCFSPGDTQMRYYVGPFDLEKFKFTPKTEGILDHAFGPKNDRRARGFYAGNVLYTPDGRCILFAWVSGFRDLDAKQYRFRRNHGRGRGWNGCVSLPRVVTLGPDGHPRQAPAVELRKLRGRHVALKGIELGSASRVVEGASGDTLEILAVFNPGDAKAFGMKVRRSDDGRRAVTLRCDGQVLDVSGTKVPLKLGGERNQDQKTLTLHVFLDKSVMEVFINNGRHCVTRVIYPGENDLGVELFSEGGKATVTAIDVWRMKSIW